MPRTFFGLKALFLKQKADGPESDSGSAPYLEPDSESQPELAPEQAAAAVLPDPQLRDIPETHPANRPEALAASLSASQPSLVFNPTREMYKLKQTGRKPTPSSNNAVSSNQLSPAIRQDSDLGWLLTAGQQMHQAESVDALLNITVAEVRQHFQVERVLIYYFQTENQGIVLAESLAGGYTPSLRESLPVVAFGADNASDYRQQPFVSLEDISQRSLTPYQRQLLERFQVMASISLPIFIREQLWGLLVIQQCSRPCYWQEAQILLLRQLVAELRLCLQPLEFSHERQAVERVSEKIRQPIDRQTLFQSVTREVRKHLNVERVAICQFRPDYWGEFVAESKGGDWMSFVGQAWEDTYVHEQQGGRFRRNEPFVLNDVQTAGLSECHIEILENAEVQACAIVAIFQGETLWGVLGAYQHSSTRHWETEEVEFLSQMAQLLGIGLQQLALAEENRQIATYQQDLPTILDKISTPTYIQDACQVAVQETQKLLNVERVAIYRFRPDYFGEFVYESETAGFPSLVGSAWEDTYLRDHRGGRFQNDESFVADDVYRAGLSDCHVAALEHFGVRSFIVVGIKQGDQLWGLLSAFQHSGIRQWSNREVMALTEIGRQLGLSLQEANYLLQLQEQSSYMANAAQISQSVTDVIAKILQSQDLQTLFQTTTQTVRRLLKCDRVSMHQFHPDGTSEWMAESGMQGLGSLKDANITGLWSHPNLLMGQETLYRYEDNWVVNNIHTVGHTLDDIAQLEELGIHAYVIAPIFKQQTLWGILSVYQTSGPRPWTEIEISALKQIAVQVGAAMRQIDYLMQLQELSAQLTQTAERQHLDTKIIERIRQSLDLQQTFKTTAREIRSFLNVDRVAIFKFDLASGHTTGETVAEDVQPGYTSALTVKVVDHCFSENFAEQYRQGRVWAIADIYAANLQSCYLDVLSQFQVRANLVVPLLRGDELWGLFCVHHCSDARNWHPTDIEFVKQIAAQLNVAIQQGEYVEQLQLQSQQLADAAQQNKAAKEQLQEEVIQLLLSVRPALDGDLTVRAPVTDTSVGTIADAYNNTLGSLQRIVMQLQTASNQVAQTSQASETAITSLSAQAQEQLRALNQALHQVEQLVASTQVVDAYVQQVESAAQQANQTVSLGDAAIDRTVDEMDEIREIVAETNQRLQRLSDSSQKISKVVSLISSFTTQTQLLALNAAIEATRAGEYGRGFAVVADEVRSLARQSANAAIEIEQLIQDIQASTAEVATAMESSNRQVASGTQVVNEARESLSSIVEAISQISQLVGSITQVMQEQTHQCQTMTQTMTQAATIANQTSEDSITISASFKALLSMAQDLQAKNAQFKVT
jgi:methyl-accepting chemotaxis protein PixJ